MNKIAMYALTAGLVLTLSSTSALAQGNMNMQPQQQMSQQQMQQQQMQQQLQMQQQQLQMQQQQLQQQRQGQMMPQQPTVRVNAMSKSTWYNAPREVQITDDRPVIRDFREAPVTPGAIGLPPGPGGNPGVLPGGGLQLGNAGFRQPQGSGPIGLPKSGFSSGSNIPSSLMRPVAGLQKGQNTGLMGNMAAPKLGGGKPSAHPTQHLANQPAAKPAAPQQLMTYSQPNGPSYGSVSSGNSTVVKSGVSAKLMNRIK